MSCCWKVGGQEILASSHASQLRQAQGGHACPRQLLHGDQHFDENTARDMIKDLCLSLPLQGEVGVP